ncbi:MAG: biliverdin-producing heme oxygenase [Gammaproteobacteria bacterium]
MPKRDAASRQVLTDLRAATNALHADLDQHVDGQRILEGKLEHDRYVQMLRAHYALHQLVATHTAAAASCGALRLLDWPACERLPALQADLTQLGASASAMLQMKLPDVPLGGLAVAVGLIYVVEGACHGTGQMLRALSENADFQSWSATAFMQVSATSVSQRWPRTLELVQSVGTEDLDGVTRGAMGGYAYYRAAWDSAVPRR